jgi:hypothetical protein
MSVKKPSNEEDEYFAKEEANRLHALAVEQARRTEAAEAERLKALHFMHCPKCGFELKTLQFKGVAIDRCFHCGGTWLDKGELEQLAGMQPSADLLHQIIGLFKHK